MKKPCPICDSLYGWANGPQKSPKWRVYAEASRAREGEALLLHEKAAGQHEGDLLRAEIAALKERLQTADAAYWEVVAQREKAEAEIAEMKNSSTVDHTEVAALKEEVRLVTHKIITCGVAATHPDAMLSRRLKDYGGPWDSPQAERVRLLRSERDALKAERDAAVNVLSLANDKAEEFMAERDALRAENERLREALDSVVYELAALVAHPEQPEPDFMPALGNSNPADAKCLLSAYRIAREAGEAKP